MGLYEDRTSRNLGLITAEQQVMLHKAHIAIAGCGTEGSNLAMALARLGIINFALADPDQFDISNLNRQQCLQADVGVNKARALADQLQRLDSNIHVRIFGSGVTHSNVGQFLEGATLVVDAIDIAAIEVSIMLNDAARKLDITTFASASVGFGSRLFIFKPDGMTMAEFLNISTYGWIGELPSYADPVMVQQVLRGERPAPAVIQGALCSAANLSTAIFLFLTGKAEQLHYAPKFLYVDMVEGRHEAMFI